MPETASVRTSRTYETRDGDTVTVYKNQIVAIHGGQSIPENVRDRIPNTGGPETRPGEFVVVGFAEHTYTTNLLVNTPSFTFEEAAEVPEIAVRCGGAEPKTEGGQPVWGY